MGMAREIEGQQKTISPLLGYRFRCSEKTDCPELRRPTNGELLWW